MGDELAQKWLNAVVPSWLYRWPMPLAWLAAIAASLPQRPSRRQLGPGFYALALHLTSCVAVFALLLFT